MTAPFRLETRRDAGTLLHRVLSSSASERREDVVEAALGLLQIEREHRVLELGCGTGDILARLAARLLRGQAVGVAVSALMARHARRRNRIFLATGRAEVRIAAGPTLAAFSDVSFDRVLGVHVVCLWEDPERHVAEIRRVLRPGGRLVLGFRAKGPAARGPQADPGQVAGWLVAGGFEVVERRSDGGEERPLAWLCARRA